MSNCFGGQILFLSIELSTELESLAQHYAAQILASHCEEATGSGAFQSVDPDTLELVRPRRVGIERQKIQKSSKVREREIRKAMTGSMLDWFRSRAY